jgi:hypothetical protein
VYINSAVAFNGNTEDRTGKESVLGGSVIGSDTLNKHAGCKRAFAEHKKNYQKQGNPTRYAIIF